MSGIGRRGAMAYVGIQAATPIMAMYVAYSLGAEGADVAVASAFILACGTAIFLSWAWMLARISGRWTPRHGQADRVMAERREGRRCRSS